MQTIDKLKWCERKTNIKNSESNRLKTHILYLLFKKPM